MDNLTNLNLSTISDINIKELLLDFEQSLINAYNNIVEDATYAEERYNSILEDTFYNMKYGYSINLKKALDMMSDFDNSPTIGQLMDIHIQNNTDAYSASFSIEMGPMLQEMQELPPIKEMEEYLQSTYQQELNNIELTVNEFWDPEKMDADQLFDVESLWESARDITYEWQDKINRDNKIKGWLNEARGLIVNKGLISSSEKDYDYTFMGIPLDNKTNTNSFHYTTKTGLTFQDYHTDMFRMVLIDIFNQIYNYNGGYLNDAEVDTINTLLNMYAKLIVVNSKAFGSKFATIVSNSDKQWYARAISSVLKSPNQIHLDHDKYSYITTKTTPEDFIKILDGNIKRWSLSFK